jgi:hypothetical protein
VHDLHATLLHLLGFDHERLIFRHQGRDYRLTDVAGKKRSDRPQQKSRARVTPDSASG